MKHLLTALLILSTTSATAGWLDDLSSLVFKPEAEAVQAVVAELKPINCQDDKHYVFATNLIVNPDVVRLRVASP